MNTKKLISPLLKTNWTLSILSLSVLRLSVLRLSVLRLSVLRLSILRLVVLPLAALLIVGPIRIFAASPSAPSLPSTLPAKPVAKSKAKAMTVLKIKGQTFKIKNLSLVSLKTEPTIDRPSTKQALAINKWSLPVLTTQNPLPSPLITSIVLPSKLGDLPRHQIQVKWSGLNDTRLLSSWSPPPLTEVKPEVTTIQSLTDVEFSLLEALVLLQEKETTPMAVGIAATVLSSPLVRPLSREVLARAYQNMGLRRASLYHYENLFTQKTEAPNIRRALPWALKILKPTDSKWAEAWLPLLKKWNIPPEQWGAITVATSRIHIERGDLQTAWDQLEQMNPENPNYSEAQFLRGVIQYRTNDLSGAKQTFERLLGRSEITRDLKSLTASTLAQIYFQEGNYEKANANYRLIEQEHPLWLESLVESAWSQILKKDFEGAAGNMFSLHTNYFKGAYQPESYIVRTVSYLQLCQYGDAQAVLKDFLRKYTFASKQLEGYKKTQPDHLKVIRDFIGAGTPKKFAGLPRSLLVEMARTPEFVSLQKRINEIEADTSHLQALLDQLKELDSTYAANLTKYQKLLTDLKGHRAKTDNPSTQESLLAEQKNHERHIQRMTLLRSILSEAQTGVNLEILTLEKTWTLEKAALKKSQAVALNQSFDHLEKDLSHWLDQSELLYYEIQNGAGEHLRYQMAAASAPVSPALKKRSPSSDEKSLEWSFDGEIWEDEIGHYRSSLKNVCPENQ